MFFIHNYYFFNLNLIMEDLVIQSRNNLFKEKNISLNEEREKNILTLRKKKLDTFLLKKRLNNSNQNNLLVEMNLNIIPELLNIPNQSQINFNVLNERVIKIIVNYLTSQNLNFIKYAIHLFKEYSVNNNFTTEDIELINHYKILEILGLILQTYYNDIQIVNEIIWIFINVQINDSIEKDFLSSIVTEKLLIIYSHLLDSNYDKIVISVLWMLNNLVIYQEFKNIIYNNAIIEKIIELSNLEICDVELTEFCLQFFYLLLHRFKFDENNKRIRKILTEIIKIGCINLFNKNQTSLLLAYKILSNISEISDNDLLEKIEEEGAVVKILKTKYKSDNLDLAINGVKIISNLFCGNNKLIEDLINMRVIDFYENILKEFHHNKQIILYCLFGLFNLSSSKYQYKKHLMNCIIFNEESFNYLIESCDNFIHEKICDIMYNLCSTKKFEMLKFLYDKKCILKIISLLYSEKNSKDTIIKYLQIIERYINSFSEKERNCIEYKNVEELYKNILSNSSNILELLDSDTFNLFSENLRNNLN